MNAQCTQGNPEFRQYFLTPEGTPLTSTVQGEAPRNQDNPRTHRVNVNNEPRIFIDGGKPDGLIYRKFMDSALFKLNSGDRAKDSADPNYRSNIGDIAGGHVTVATDAEAKAFQNGNELEQTRVPRVSHLPETVQRIVQPITNFTISQVPDTPDREINVEIDSTETERNKYLLSLSTGMRNWLEGAVTGIKQYVDSNEVFSNGFQIMSGSDNETANSTIAIQTVDANETDTTRYGLQIQLHVSDDETLAGNNTGTVVSERAIRQYVTDTVGDIDALTARVNIIATGNAGSDTPTVRKADFVDLQDALTRISTMEGGRSEEKLGVPRYETDILEFIQRDGSIPMTGDLTLARDATLPDHAVNLRQLQALETIVNNLISRITIIENRMNTGLNERINLRNQSSVNVQFGLITGAIT